MIKQQRLKYSSYRILLILWSALNCLIYALIWIQMQSNVCKEINFMKNADLTCSPANTKELSCDGFTVLNDFPFRKKVHDWS